MIQAITFAEQKHRNQRRICKDQTPYIVHPLRVAEILCERHGEKTDVIVAALLHDTVEDTGTKLEEIDRLFGPSVASIVGEVTDDKSLPSTERKRLQVEHAPHCSPYAKLVKLADKIANLEDLLTKPNGAGIPVGWSVQRIQEYCKWALAVAEGLKGEDEQMDARLRELVGGTFEDSDGTTHPAMIIQ